MRLFRRRRKVEPPLGEATPSGRIVVQFKSSEELADGTEAGKVFVYDDEDPDTFLEEVKWMTQAEAEKFAKERGYEYEEM